MFVRYVAKEIESIHDKYVFALKCIHYFSRKFKHSGVYCCNSEVVRYRIKQGWICSIITSVANR